MIMAGRAYETGCMQLNKSYIMTMKFLFRHKCYLDANHFTQVSGLCYNNMRMMIFT